MSKPVLYHVPPSFYSQIARLALAETHVSYDSIYVLPGPPSFESYAPWYMHLNPDGCVPTLVHEGNTLPDSGDILGYLGTRFPEQGLWRDAVDNGEIDVWVDALYAVSFRELSYGSPKVLKFGIWINEKRLSNLRTRRRNNPQLAKIYSAKIADIEGFSANAQNFDHMHCTRRNLERSLNGLDEALTSNDFLVGEVYSLADLVWTVGIARLMMIGMSPLEQRPGLQAWYERVKARPSFRQAGVMEHFQPSALLRVLWARFSSRISGNSPYHTAAHGAG